MPSDRANTSTSYRLDPETHDLIAQLRERLRDPETGQRRSATDVIRYAVRELARKRLATPSK